MRRADWGAMGDKRSRLRRLRNLIELEELSPVYEANTRLDKRRRRHAATYLAMWEQAAEGLGTDPKSTPSRLSRLDKMAENKLAKIRAPGAASASLSISAALRRAQGPA